MKKSKNEHTHKINNEISRYNSVKEVRVVTQTEDIENGIYTLKEAIKMAENEGLDLIEINAKANPPVCKIEDYKKFLYNSKKNKKEQEKKNKVSQQKLKELRFGPNTDEHDFNFKLEHAINFLKQGNKVKAYVFFKGREIAFKDKGEILLLKLAESLEEYGIPEALPKLEGRKMIMFIKPKKKN